MRRRGVAFRVAPLRASEGNLGSQSRGRKMLNKVKEIFDNRFLTDKYAG